MEGGGVIASYHSQISHETDGIISQTISRPNFDMGFLQIVDQSIGNTNK